MRRFFFADLGEKDWVIVLRNVANRVVGFSTQQLISNVLGADNVRFLFSGDTMVSPEYWNTPYLSGCFGYLMLRLMDTHPGTPLYWFLISKRSDTVIRFFLDRNLHYADGDALACLPPPHHPLQPQHPRP